MATTPADNNEAPVPQTFTLNIVSPSAAFTGPVSFSDLPTTTTVLQLKAKIREKVESRPTDEHQRLIHRGRLLREEEVLLDVFGQERLRNAESQTLHLVLYPVPRQSPSTGTSAAQGSTILQESQTQSLPFHIPEPPISLPNPPRRPQFQDVTTNGILPLSGLRQPGQIHPTVYILSSPSGPRALLITDTSTYFTPRPRGHPQPHLLPAHNPPQPGQPIPYQPQFQPQVRQVDHHHNDHAAQHPHLHQHAHAPAGQLAQPDGAVLLGHHQRNPAAAGALAVQLAPHVWLVIRLLGFIWFFTSGNTSWWRWSMITGLSVIFFLANTGLVNWAPIRRHLENLIPLGMPAVNAAGAAVDGQPAPAGLRVAAGADTGAGTGNGTGDGDLDPERVAERLVEQRRRADAGWVVAQVRRVEHAVLLFLASLWPGVGERHVAAREVEDQARRRREEAAEAERAAAQEAAQAETREAAEVEAAEVEAAEVEAAEAAEATEVDPKDAGGEGSGDADTTGQSSGMGARETQEQPLIDV